MFFTIDFYKCRVQNVVKVAYCFADIAKVYGVCMQTSHICILPSELSY
jgi:hypothetical protein